MNCPYCNKEAKIVSGKKIYPHRPDLKEKLFWLCVSCNAYVGCHGNTTNPLGILADKELRQLRIQAHEHFDKYWKQGKMNRKEAYQWLAVKLNIPYEKCHIGMFNKEMCRKLFNLSQEKDYI